MLSLKNKSSGFTIIELMISLAILGLVIPAIASGINNLTVLNNRTRDLTLTNLIAENKAEHLRNDGFNSLSEGSVDFTDELPIELAPPRSATYTVTNSQPGIVEIDISITYQDYGNPRTQEYKTIISELGVGQ